MHQARAFYEKMPNSLLAQHLYGVMCGDCADHPSHCEEEKQLYATAKKFTQMLFENPEVNIANKENQWTRNKWQSF